MSRGKNELWLCHSGSCMLIEKTEDGFDHLGRREGLGIDLVGDGGVEGPALFEQVNDALLAILFFEEGAVTGLRCSLEDGFG